MTEHQKKVPREINKPITIYWFEIDEVIILLFAYIGMVLFGGKILLWIVAGISMMIIYMRLKRKKSRGFLKHCLYYYLGINLKHYPNGLIRKFRE